MSVLLLNSNALNIPLADGSVQCVVTSPPYYGLRDYGTGRWVGGDPECDHKVGRFETPCSDKQRSNSGSAGHQAREVCPKCGAIRIDAQIGLEQSPDAYVAAMVAVFREVKRVLRPDGVVFLNLGDSYAGSGKGGQSDEKRSENWQPTYGNKGMTYGLKPKDLIGIPWRLAFALQADGWYLRSEIIWGKSNPMPESVRDRPTKSHEQIFLFTKGQWVSRVIELANLPSEFVHFSYNFGFDSTNVRGGKIAVCLAATILDVAQSQYQLCLSPFDPQIGQQSATGSNSHGITTLPVIHRAAVGAARFLGSHTSAKEFLSELYSLGITLTNGNKLLIGGGAVILPLPPGVYSDGYASIAVNDSGKISKFDFVHGSIITQSPSGCKYYWDADAVAEPCVVGWNGSSFTDNRDAATKPGLGQGPRNETPTRNIRTVWTIPTKPYKGAHFACVDQDTECLTVDGWKRHDQLNIGDQIAVYDLETASSKWAPLQDLYTYQVVNQEMIRLKGRGIDQLLTPNHRCVVRRRSGKDVICEANALIPSNQMLVASTWQNNGNINFPERLARLVGWFVTEGTIGKDCVYIYQSGDANPYYCQEIRTLLQDEGAEFSEHSRQRPYKDRTVTEVTWRITGVVASVLLGLCPNKHLPENFLMWDGAALAALWDALMKGDGHFREAGRQTFVQKDLQTISQVQALATRLGYATTLRKRSEGTYSLYKTESTTRRLSSETTSLITREEYSGVVWCPHTHFGTFIARRNGYVFITGNTYPPALVEPCIKAGTSERGACPTCGTAWERVVERAVVGYSPSPRSNGNKDRNDAQDGRTERQSTTIGWRPACDCYGTAPWPSIPRKGRDEADDAYEQRVAPIRERRAELLAFYDTLPTVPCVVLDPFAGSGTTLLVARDLGRDAVGLDLSYAYLHDQARVRLGLDKLSEWQNGKTANNTALDELPLFANQD